MEGRLHSRRQTQAYTYRERITTSLAGNKFHPTSRVRTKTRKVQKKMESLLNSAKLIIIVLKLCHNLEREEINQTHFTKLEFHGYHIQI